MVKITTIERKPEPEDEDDSVSLRWQRLAAFLAVSLVILGSVWLLGDNEVIKALAITTIPALVSGYLGKLYGQPLPAVTQQALKSMPPEKAEKIIEVSLRNMQPNIAQGILERASQPPANTTGQHGSEKET